MSMAPHLAGLARHGGVDVTLMWGEPVAFDEQSDRKQVARALEAEVRRRTVRALRGRAAEAASSE
jgi:1-acyl-sn-glycerol-3-phosphate acyltransferase